MTISQHTSDNRAKRVAAYKEKAYGLFLHFGLYSILEEGEWVRFHHDLNPEKYNKLTERFSVENFDADQLVKWASECGFRYICMTTRHHDGFSLYDTRGLNKFDAPHSKAKRDIVAEFSKACHEQNMGLFFYHTTLDWWEPRFKNDWKGYLQYLRDSVEVLCTNYGKVDGFWFDGNWANKDADWEEDALYSMIRKHQPEAILINNSSVNALGKKGHPMLDVVTFEQGLPNRDHDSDLATEMCETIHTHWGYAKHDFSHKSPADLIKELVICRAHGANFLLNVGPKADGTIDPLDKAIIERIQRWIDATLGDALYNAEPTNLKCQHEDLLMKTDEGYLYFAFNLPVDKNSHNFKGPSDWNCRKISGELTAVKSVQWLDNNEDLHFSQELGSKVLNLKLTANPYGSQFEVRVAKIVV